MRLLRDLKFTFYLFDNNRIWKVINVFNIIITILNIIVLLVLIYYLNKQRKNLIAIEQQNIEILENNSEFKEILLLGIYNRFKKDNLKILNPEEDEDIKKTSDLFVLRTPSDFEDFSAKIIRNYYGGKTYVLGHPGDFGVDFEHDIKENRFLGQVKCHCNDIPYDPIALVHSNMEKEGAVGGYVITTSDFTISAYNYAEGLNIELINGEKLVEYWLSGLQKEHE